MPRHDTVRPMTEGQRVDLTATLIQAMPPLSFADAKNITSNKRAFCKDIRAVFAKYSLEWTANKKLMEWYHFYKNEFGLDLNFAGITIPQRREGFDRLIVVPQGLTIQQVLDKCGEKFPVFTYAGSDFRNLVIVNSRDATHGHYAIRVRDRVEADEEWKDHSAKLLTGVGMKGETLHERLLHELKYFLETGKHLDISSTTLCSGSRDSVGGVFGVHWSDTDRLAIGIYSTADSHDRLRSRQVIDAVAA
ncbi:MAG: Uncharacterized protein G01um101477_270 [Candidatus Doudnabacteria bacterium Gr01-1014_77]|uniref:Uncharacterized protein n=1 Tax=Candidatus Doudnabacteria bacterium Gr01-1014_77 TaxID=2017133 RepID=A0A554JC90_9BACT|nr:MAG: Uncharacterized protein G01um101477_270 [Candidatus Doudnabacteria bacterium Gr01-1014_77]